MNFVKCSAAALTAGLTLAGSNALAAKACNLVGTYTDTLGSTIIFTSNKAGTAQNSAICSSTYKLKVKKNTSKAIDVTGKAKGCGNLTANFVPNYPTCTSASGTVTIQGLGSLPDTITKQGGAAAAPRTQSALEHGLR